MADEMSTDQLVNEIEKLVEADGSRGQPEQQQNNVEEGDIGEEDKTTNHREEEEREREEETEKLKQVQSEAEKKMNLSSMPAGAGAGTGGGGAVTLSFEDKVEVDSRSIYVGNVDYGTTSEELETHFHGCGPIKRITIPCNKFDGHQKGFAYIEFGHKNSVDTAMTLDGSLFRGRPIKVLPKRTNIPGMSTTNRGARGGRGRSRGGFRGGPFFGFH